MCRAYLGGSTALIKARKFRTLTMAKARGLRMVGDAKSEATRMKCESFWSTANDWKTSVYRPILLYWVFQAHSSGPLWHPNTQNHLLRDFNCKSALSVGDRSPKRTENHGWQRQAFSFFFWKLVSLQLCSDFTRSFEFLIAGRKRGRACVVVLGDIGRSPRMQYHALSLARQVTAAYLNYYSWFSNNPILKFVFLLLKCNLKSEFLIFPWEIWTLSWCFLLNVRFRRLWR